MESAGYLRLKWARKLFIYLSILQLGTCIKQHCLDMIELLMRTNSHWFYHLLPCRVLLQHMVF
jgi:hypothetical protein